MSKIIDVIFPTFLELFYLFASPLIIAASQINTITTSFQTDATTANGIALLYKHTYLRINSYLF